MKVKNFAPQGQQNGGVIIEASVWIAFFALLVPVLTDIFFISNTRLSLNQIAREALVTEISYPESLVNLNVQYTHETTDNSPPTRAQELADLDACTNGSVYRNKNNFSIDCAHKFIKWRIRRLIESHELRVKPENITFGTYLDHNGIMSVMIETSYDSFSFFFKNKRLKTMATARYMGNT